MCPNALVPSAYTQCVLSPCACVLTDSPPPLEDSSSSDFTEFDDSESDDLFTAEYWGQRS